MSTATDNEALLIDALKMALVVLEDCELAPFIRKQMKAAINAVVPPTSPDILTNTGGYFKFLEPWSSDFDIETIAHALSHICRFTGHTRVFYSVAQHSVITSHLVPAEHQLAALLHDAAEAFLGDVSKPLKGLLPDYGALEKKIEPAVFARFGLPETLDKSIKHADLVMLLTEARDLMPEHDNAAWALRMGATPLEGTIEPWSSERAKTESLQRYIELTESYAPREVYPDWQLS